jgi:hypothetical protein
MARPSWRVASACEIGTSHVGSGTPCQDSAAHVIIRTKEGPVLVVVVCDGAGSAAHSEIGSWLAATTFVELVEVHFENGGRLVDISSDKVVGWITNTADRLSARAREDGNPRKDYSCTLIAAIVGNEAAAFVQIGDGAIVVSHGEADGWSWVFWPQHGEYANQTVFVLSANATEALEFNLAQRRIDELALFLRRHRANGPPRRQQGRERFVFQSNVRADSCFNVAWARPEAFGATEAIPRLGRGQCQNQ